MAGVGQQTDNMVIYDAANTSVVVNGQELYGFKGGQSVFQVEWDNDRSSIDQDSFGTTVVSRNHKDSATLTINLNSTSKMNSVLAELCETNAVFPVEILSDTDHIWTSKATITKMAPVSVEDQAPGRTWTIHMLNANYAFAGK
ncbi:MAG: hypothetical protein [Bacteriophage sp.]|nr:MAG: hypothetical protein [Bacteriophage sp.]